VSWRDEYRGIQRNDSLRSGHPDAVRGHACRARNDFARVRVDASDRTLRSCPIQHLAARDAADPSTREVHRANRYINRATRHINHAKRHVHRAAVRVLIATRHILTATRQRLS